MPFLKKTKQNKQKTPDYLQSQPQAHGGAFKDTQILAVKKQQLYTIYLYRVYLSAC